MPPNNRWPDAFARIVFYLMIVALFYIYFNAPTLHR